MMLAQVATLPGRDDKPNEDYAGVLPSSAVLLDGAGGPSEMPSGCVHGTPWFVRQLGARLLWEMETAPERPLPHILAGGIRFMSGLHRGTCDLDAPGTPASVVVMARARADEFEYLVLGDSAIVIDTGAVLETVTDRRIDAVAAAERKAMEALPTGTPEHQAARIRFVALQRELRNKPGGYWTASTDQQAAFEAYAGSVPLDAVRAAALLSDGVTRFVDFGLGNWADLMDLLAAEGPAGAFTRVREAEASDPDGERWPRAKRRDDVAVVHLAAIGGNE